MCVRIVELGEFLARRQEQKYCAIQVLYVARKQLVNPWVVCAGIRTVRIGDACWKF